MRTFRRLYTMLFFQIPMFNFIQLIVLHQVFITIAATDLSYTPLTDEISKQMSQACSQDVGKTPILPMPAGEVVVTPPGVVLPNNYRNYAQRILDMEVRSDDTWIISFPKCGTTLTQELVWLLKNNFDLAQAKSQYLYLRFQFLEYKAICTEGNFENDNIGSIEETKSPRFIWTHLPIDLLPKQIWTKKPKIIYISRNPKDTALSYYHHFKIWNNYIGSRDLFLQAFVEDKVVFSPFWDHLLSFWKLRKEENILYITFEDAQKDLSTIVDEVAEFLGVTYTTDQKKALLDHLSVAKMKDNKYVNFEDDIKTMPWIQDTKFIVEEDVHGAWTKIMSPEYIKKFDEWTAKNLKGTDYPMPKN